VTRKLAPVLLLLSCLSVSAQTIQHIVYIQMENRSFDELFGTLPGVQNYCRGGNSPKRCSNNQSTSCSTVGKHDVCGTGWCEPIQCTTPTGPECSVGDSCPQITTYVTGNGSHLYEQLGNQVYPDMPHDQRRFIMELANGAMNGWPKGAAALSYFISADIRYHYLLAMTYGLADNHFSALGGPSQPGHAMMFAASSHDSSDNPSTTLKGGPSPGEISGFLSSWGCGAHHFGPTLPYLYSGTLISTDPIDGTQYFGGTNVADRTKACTCRCPTGTKCGVSTFTLSGCRDTVNGGTCDINYSRGGTAGAPCPTITTLADEAEAHGVTWGYYSYSPKWNAAAQFQQIYFNKTRWNSHVRHDYQFDTDVSNCSANSCSLPQLVWLSPDNDSESEHPGLGTMAAGEAWLQNRLTPFFHNPYAYAHTVVFITWDDWGGPYDHVPPPQTDSLPSLGFRVPLICIGPYCKNRIIHTQFEFASVLHCMENVFSLPTLNSRDAGATDACKGTGTLTSNTDGMINLSQAPIPAIP